jgi:hypothetical protein
LENSNDEYVEEFVKEDDYDDAYYENDEEKYIPFL